MQLRELNLPLENNLFVINTNDKDQDVDPAFFGDTNVMVDSFELDIQVFKYTNAKPNSHVKIVNNSTSSEGASLASHLAKEAFPTPKESNFRDNLVMFAFRNMIISSFQVLAIICTSSLTLDSLK